MASRKKIWWLVWVLLSGFLASFGGYALMGDQQWLLLPGDTTHGHHQIEMQCKECHGKAFDGDEVVQENCVRCHGAELKAVDDSHPKAKFTDPRNADRLAKLDARYCVTCHMEHKPHATSTMGVTAPPDVCVLCHDDIGEDRESHIGMKFDTCASAGCHNFHDNKALYEDFLIKHATGLDTLIDGRPLQRNLHDWLIKTSVQPPAKLTATHIDYPHNQSIPGLIIDQWQHSAHANGAVNCGACHFQTPGVASSWTDHPATKICTDCHQQESGGFKAGRHGMRLAVGLSPMTPDMALIPMHGDVGDKALTCTTCHGPHELNLAKASVEACLGCHDDDHSRAFKKSRHFELFMAAGPADRDAGVSCATCHMPRREIREKGEFRVLVDHNQNAALRPNEKQIRSICLNCHSLRFAIDSLADTGLVARNFSGQPAVHIDSIDMALVRQEKKAREKEGGVLER